jgi:hypothetical protein
MIRQHPLHVQALDIDNLALVYQSTALLVKKVRTLVGNFLMQTGDLHPRFLAVLAALLFSGELALEAAQLLFHPAKRLRRIDLLPLRSDGKAFQPQVQSDFFPLAFGWAVFHFHFAQDRCEIPARRAAGDGHALECTGDRAMHHDLERRQLGEAQPALVSVQSKVLRYAKRLLVAPAFELRKLRPARKKVHIGPCPDSVTPLVGPAN